MMHPRNTKSLGLYRRVEVFAFLTMLILYLAFLPTGPYPLEVAGLRLEYVLFCGICCTSLLLIDLSLKRLYGDYARVQLSLLAYLVTIALSTALSFDPESSNRAFGTALGYAYLMCIVPPLIYTHLDLIRKALLVLAAITACLLLYLNMVLGFGVAQRFALADTAERTSADATNYVDPNMTAIGMLMCAVISLPLVWRIEQSRRFFPKLVCRCLLMIILGATLLFISRTAILSLAVAIVLALMAIAGRGLRMTRLFRAVVPAITVFAGAAMWRREELSHVLMRSSDLVESEQGHSGRVELYQGALADWISSVKSVIVGNGYYSSNPHNEFLRTLAGDGILGFMAFAVLLFFIYRICCSGKYLSTRSKFSQTALFAFIISAMMTYGHTKTMWLAFLFLVASYLEEHDQGGRRGNIQRVKLPRIPIPSSTLNGYPSSGSADTVLTAD